MDKIKVRIIKDRSINLKVNSEIFEQIKNAAIRNKHFIADYINIILFEHLKRIESLAKAQNAPKKNIGEPDDSA